VKCNTIKLVQMVDGQLVASVTTPENVRAFMAVRAFVPIGTRNQLPLSVRQYREEIVGLPIFDQLCGPMYDGPGVARYEDTAANQFLSN
jgi:hypothetical protein